MCKDTTNNGISQEKNLFSFQDVLPDRKTQVDFNTPDILSNGGLVLVGLMEDSVAQKIARLIPDHRNRLFVQRSYEEMVCQRVGQVMCGYENADDCDRLRHDSALKMSMGRRASDPDLYSQPTIARLENHIDKRTLWKIAELFVKDYISSFDKAPRKIILDVDDTNANTCGAQRLSLFNGHYDEYCYMPMVIFDGMNSKLILPLLRPGRRSKSLNTFGILRRVVEYIHKEWSHTIIEPHGDSHFCSHEFMDQVKTHLYVRFITGLSSNPALIKKIDKQLRRTKGGFELHHGDVRRCYGLEYKAESWKYRQGVIAKIEVSDKGVNVRFIVTGDHNNKPETVYRRYCKHGTMELWIKDLRYFRADRMSCSFFRVNMFRLFLYGAAYVTAYRLRPKAFSSTEVGAFTMDSFMKRIILSAVFIIERETFIRFSFSPHHRHLEALSQTLARLSAWQVE